MAFSSALVNVADSTEIPALITVGLPTPQSKVYVTSELSLNMLITLLKNYTFFFFYLGWLPVCTVSSLGRYLPGTNISFLSFCVQISCEWMTRSRKRRKLATKNGHTSYRSLSGRFFCKEISWQKWKKNPREKVRTFKTKSNWCNEM